MSRLTHDLRGSLTVIEGFVDLLLRQGDDLGEEERAAHLERIRAAAREIAGRLDELDAAEPAGAPAAPAQSGVAAVGGGGRLAYRIEGSGPDLVLIHAGVADLRMWDALVALLRDRFRIVRYDLRGFGSSTSPPGAHSHAEDLIALLGQLSLERPTLVGASFGGQVALEAAALAPDRIGRLVLLSPALPDHEWSARMEAFGEAEEAALEAGRIDEAVELNVAMWIPDGDAAMRRLVAEMQGRAFRNQLAAGLDEVELDPPVTARLSEIAIPVTIAVGERDVEDFAAIAQRLAAGLPAASLQRIDDAGHVSALERPGAVAALIAEACA